MIWFDQNTLCWTFRIQHKWLPHSWILFSVGLFLALSTRTPSLKLLKPNRDVLMHITARLDVGKPLGDLMQWLLCYCPVVIPSALIFSLCSSSQAGSKMAAELPGPTTLQNTLWRKMRSLLNACLRNKVRSPSISDKLPSHPLGPNWVTHPVLKQPLMTKEMPGANWLGSGLLDPVTGKENSILMPGPPLTGQ